MPAIHSTIESIKVTSVNLKCKCDADDWYSAIFVITFTNKSTSRSLVKSTMAHWQNQDYALIMEKGRETIGENNVVPKLRTSTRGDTDRSATNNERRIEDWHDKEFPIVWKMDEDLRRTALSLSDA